jgi:hypothetical protein
MYKYDWFHNHCNQNVECIKSHLTVVVLRPKTFSLPFVQLFAQKMAVVHKIAIWKKNE